MHHALETDVLEARAELRRHHATVGLKPQLHSERIGFAADKARVSMGQFFDHADYFPRCAPIFLRNGSMERGRPRNFSMLMFTSRESPCE